MDAHRLFASRNPEVLRGISNAARLNTGKSYFRCALLPWPAGTARWDVPLNQVLHNGAGQRGQAPRLTIRELRRRYSAAACSSLIHPEPKARKAEQQNQRMGAGRKEGFCVGRPLGAGAEAPEIFWVLLYLYKSTSPGGETSPSPSRPQAKSSEN